MSSKIDYYPRLRLQRASKVGDGMRVEACRADEAGNLVDIWDPILYFRAIDEKHKQVVIHTDLGRVAFPLDELARAIDFARKEVHCEGFYEEERMQEGEVVDPNA